MSFSRGNWKSSAIEGDTIVDGSRGTELCNRNRITITSTRDASQSRHQVTEIKIDTRALPTRIELDLLPEEIESPILP